MFTGIVERKSTISAITVRPEGCRLTVTIDASTQPELPEWRAVELGESIAVNGVCLTVVEFENLDTGGWVSFDAIPETLTKTTLGELVAGDEVNLERSLRVGDMFGGHYVTGHVDGTAVVRSRETQGDQTLFWIRCGQLARQILPKGSIAVDGISLTVIDVEPPTDAKEESGAFSFAAIPHTLERTTLNAREPGRSVNIETDAFGKWVLQGLQQTQLPPGAAPSQEA